VLVGTGKFFCEAIILPVSHIFFNEGRRLRKAGTAGRRENLEISARYFLSEPGVPGGADETVAVSAQEEAVMGTF
jgi:hypothetical protein